MSNHYDKYKKGLDSGRAALAINAEGKRSEDQLHIHMSCLNDDVHESLMKYKTVLGKMTEWDNANNPLKLTYATSGHTAADHSWYAIHVDSLAGENNPFNLIKKNEAVTDDNMHSQNIVVTPIDITFSPKGFYILNGNGPNDRGEDLIDGKANCFKR